MEKSKKKRGTKNNGITLIALVITIIVLLILAGVSIATLTGDNGILTKATESKEQTEIGEEKEAIGIAYNGVKIGNEGKDVSATDLQTELRNNGYNATVADNGDGTLTVTFDTGRSYTIDENGNITNETTGGNETDVAGKYYGEDTDITVGGKPIAIPGGATISGIEGEYESVDDGLVIYITNGDTITDWNADTNSNGIKDVQETYDQFVWVPVEKAIVTEEEIGGNSYENLKNYVTANGKYPMAIQLSDGTYKGILYDFKEENGAITVTPKDYTTIGDYREPAYLKNSSYADGSSYNNVGITEDSLQAEYKMMIERVEEKGGFWAGRYETSNMVSNNTQDSTNRIKVIKGTTTGISNVNWYRMYAQQKSYSNLALTNSTGITSSMIWGSQWYQILIWMKNVKNTINTTKGEYYITNAVGMGNYGSISGVDDGWNEESAAPTGYQENYKVKNIYDLAGNVCDWTLEAALTSNRAYRRR